MSQTTSINHFKSKDFRIGVLYLMANLVVSVAAQFMLKRGMLDLGEFELAQGGMYLLEMINPLIIGGLLLYAAGTLLWLLCLTKLDLSFAYPTGTLQYLLVFVGAWILFDENISPLRIAGLVVICTGVFVLAFDLRKK